MLKLIVPLGIVLSVFLGPVMPVSAQENISPPWRERARIGVLAGYGLSAYNADFRTLPGVPNCCEGFSEGGGGDLYAGVHYEQDLFGNIAGRLRLLWLGMSGSLDRQALIGNALHNGQTVDALVEHTIEARLGALALEPGLVWRPLERPLSLALGLQAGLPLQKSYTQQEVLLAPQNAVFTNGLAVRNQSSGTIPEAHPVSLALTFGAAYAFPVGNRTRLAPELSYSLGLIPLVRGLDWQVNTLRFGLALETDIATFFTVPRPHVPSATPKPVLPELESPAPLPPPPSVSISVEGVYPDGSRVSDPVLKVEDVRKDEFFPLLLQVFFDSAAADLSRSRQVLLETQAVGEFREDSLVAQTLPVYHNMLNILGARMRAHPETRISITGYAAPEWDGPESAQIGRERAAAVRAYLADVWGIALERMLPAAAGLPPRYSRTDTRDGQAENRRVEISTEDFVLNRPVYLIDRYRSVEPDSLEVLPFLSAPAGLREWELHAGTGREVLVSYTGAFAPELLGFRLDPEAISHKNPRFTIDFSARDTEGRPAETSTTLTVEMSQVHIRSIHARSGYQLDKFSLILYDFDSDAISRGNREIMRMVGERIAPTSYITIIGYTDRIGEADYNKGLARRRCEGIRRYLLAQGVEGSRISIQAVGSDVLLFDNSLPEGRTYSRTVQIVITTPL